MPSFNEEHSDTDSDDEFNEDMEALKRACQLTGRSPIDNQLQLPSTSGAAASSSASSEAESDGEGEDDLQLVRSIQKRFAVSTDMEDEALNTKPLCTLPPDWSDSDDWEDDYETLRAIQRRFAAYSDGGLKDNVEVFAHRPVQVGASIIDSEKETSNSFVESTNAREGFLNCVDTSESNGKKSEACHDAGGRESSDLVEWNGAGADDVTGMPLQSFHFPKSALAFVDAIKKNRSCQKLIRSKMMQIEARIEELNKLMGHVKILKNFQVCCKKRAGRTLSQKKDARIQLISVPKQRANMKCNEKKTPAVYKGPPENSRVSNYKEAMAAFAVSVRGEKWSKEEGENILKGLKQQFQKMSLQQSFDQLREADGSYDSGNVDNIIVPIRDLDMTPEQQRQFLPKVNWEQLAAMYVPGRSGAECQARFLNCEDRLINHNPWTAMEDKNLLHIVQQKGLSNWIDIAASLETNRTPFQCLARYQRSLNASILKREWTTEEDNQLRTAVETYGESNWQLVASVMEGRTGTQCSNRWLKTLHPARQRVGKWTAEEDKRLKVSVTLFGPKTWKKVARCVPGRTQVQCRERWVNCLDPSLNMAEWAEEEDSKLEAAIAEHGYCWSKVASCIPRRTDNQCWRRWKVLFPSDVPRLQAARKIQKAALISNFVDRESERPALGPNDFLPPAETYLITGSENVDPSRTKKRRSRRREAHEHREKDALSGEISSEEVPRLTNGSEVENLQGRTTRRKGRGKSSRSIKKDTDPSCSHSSPYPLDMSNDEENRKSRVNDGGSKRKPRMQKKRSGVKSKSVDRPDSEDYEHSDPAKECSLLTIMYPRVELGGADATQSKKASKLHPRRKRGKMAEEVPENLSEVDTPTEATTLRTTNEIEEKKQTTNDHPSLFPDSMLLMEAFHAIKARKRKRNTQETCSNIECVPLDVDYGSMRLWGHESFSCQVEFVPDQNFRSNTDSAISGNLDDSVIYSSEMVVVEAGSRNQNEACPYQALEVVAGDDTTIAHFYDKLKKRRRCNDNP